MTATNQPDELAIVKGQLATANFLLRQTQRVAAIYEHAVKRIVAIVQKAIRDVDNAE